MKLSNYTKKDKNLFLFYSGNTENFNYQLQIQRCK
jgi:hypothetical protein